MGEKKTEVWAEKRLSSIMDEKKTELMGKKNRHYGREIRTENNTEDKKQKLHETTGIIGERRQKDKMG